MKGNTHEKDLDALHTGIAKSREEIAALTAGLKKLEEREIDKSSVAGEKPQKGPANGDVPHGGWTVFRHKLDEAGAIGKSVVKGIADEIERHPLIGSVAAFGLGFVIAKLLFKRSKNDSRQ